MTYTITATNGAGSTAPISVEGYTPSRQSRNIIHDLLDGSIGVSYIAPRPRSGSLRLLYTSEALAFTALNLFAAETSFIFTSTDNPAVGMTFALDGSIDMERTADVNLWWVNVGYQEVS
ncbi:hypothetical protein [Microbacterium sp. PRC9]|uniref:hypothetical protein n=1 Tax=Microbacterium sp. PRC9 TaxID=2962591 RepID=UPI0028818E9F|nr:hypothetical protein [Microbacterium sp. PRC9]MDT0142795.1 hypothetical protein [Microbacterium sp. PRC9]